MSKNTLIDSKTSTAVSGEHLSKSEQTFLTNAIGNNTYVEKECYNDFLLHMSIRTITTPILVTSITIIMC